MGAETGQAALYAALESEDPQEARNAAFALAAVADPACVPILVRALAAGEQLWRRHHVTAALLAAR